MATREVPQGSFGKSYIDEGDAGIQPPFVFVKNALGQLEKQESLSSKWLLNFEWLDYYPEDNIRDHRLQYLNQDLVMLLRLKHNVFWSQIAYDPSFARFLNSFLLYARRVGTTRSVLSSDTTLAGTEASADPALLSPSHKTLLRNVFSVVVRMATAKEAPGIGFGSPKTHAELVAGVLDLPRLLDFTTLYARFNLPLVSSIISHLFSIEPKYNLELAKAVSTISQVILEMSRRLSQCLQLALNPSSSVSAATPPSQDDENRLQDVRATCEDLATYFIDLVYAFSTFTKAHPDTYVHFVESDTISILSYALRALLPNLKIVFEHIHHAAFDCLRRHYASRNHALSIINKIISSVMLELHTELRPTDASQNHSRVALPASVFRTRVPKIQKLISYLVHCLQALTISDRQLVARVAKSPEDNRPLAWLLLADELQHTFASSSASQDSHLHSSTGLTQTELNPETFAIALALDKKYSIQAQLEGLREHIVIAADEEKESTKANVVALETALGELGAILAKAKASEPAPHSSSANQQQELKWQESVKKSAQVREIFADLSEGFVAYALWQHYKNDTEHMVRDLLEQNLPPDLNRLDKKLGVEEAKKMALPIDTTEAYKRALQEDMERFKLDTTKMTTISRKPGAKTSYTEAMRNPDAEAVARATLKLVERQERDEEQRTYMTQLKRARGEAVDEEDEELFEQLRASAELRERAERGALTYEDEPDDSLDDFHPVGALADDSHDNLISKAKHGPLRSKFSNRATFAPPSLPNKSQPQDDAFELEDDRMDDEDLAARMQADFEADDAALLPYSSSSSSHPGMHSANSAHRGGNPAGGYSASKQHSGAGRGQPPRDSSNKPKQSSQPSSQNASQKSTQKGAKGGSAKSSSSNAPTHAHQQHSQQQQQHQHQGQAKRSSGSNQQHNQPKSTHSEKPAHQSHQQQQNRQGGRGKGRGGASSSTH